MSAAIDTWRFRLGGRIGAAFLREGGATKKAADADAFFAAELARSGPLANAAPDQVRRGFDERLAQVREFVR